MRNIQILDTTKSVRIINSSNTIVLIQSAVCTLQILVRKEKVEREVGRYEI
jgi:hypothetical protein